MIDQALLKSEERAVYALRSLYRQYGYLPFKMSKFEEYELYARNKDFLVSDRVITFNDTNGRLMALKPDVTLSIIKNFEGQRGCKQKVYYSENVYRVSGGTRQFKEILQAGLECMGEIDLYDVYESISLAAQSLGQISEQYLLEVSHLGLLKAILEETGAEEAACQEITRCIAEKNAHDLRRVCEGCGLGSACADRLCAFVEIYGEREQVLRRMESVCVTARSAAALKELRQLDALLAGSGLGEHIRYDFSLVNNMSYYNGIVFKGYLSGIAEGVLSGGQYDALMRRMGKQAGAVGFAVYLDLLENLQPRRAGDDVDVLVLYDDATPPAELAAQVHALIGEGQRVSAQKAIPEKLRCTRILDMRKAGV